MLAYTIQKLLERQEAMLERDVAVPDSFGAEAAQNWQPLSTVPCTWWWIKESYRGPGKEEVTASETVPIGKGGMLVFTTDITTDDRIARVINGNGQTVLAGPLNINAVLPHPTYPALTEIWFQVPN